MVLNFENIQHLFTISLALLFSFYMFINKTKERSGNIFIGLFVLYFGIESFEVLITQSSFYSLHPNLYLILPNLGLLLYPVFFFYIKSVTYKGFKLKWGDLIHLAPYFAIVIITLFEYHLKPTEVQLSIMKGRNDMPWFISAIYYSLRIQSIVYLVLSIRVAFRFKKIVKENYSSINKRNYKWILQLTFVFVYFVLTAMIHNILKFGFEQAFEKVPFYILSTISFSFLVWIIYKGISQPYLFNGVDANIKLLNEYIDEQKEETKLKEKEIPLDKDLKFKLEEYINTNEFYLNPNLTIFELAEELGSTSHDLSFYLNRVLHKNFFDYINEYRIKKAMHILQDPTNKQLTILEILYEVGFNSKSSFNTAFKKHTKLTPTQYRKNDS